MVFVRLNPSVPLSTIVPEADSAPVVPLLPRSKVPPLIVVVPV